MNRLAVVGNPVAHSLSPVIFNSIAKDNNIKSHYTRVCGDSFYQIVNLLEILDIGAFNITSPFKDEAFNIAQETCIDSNYTSASNLIIRNKGLAAFNTDFNAITNILKNVTYDKTCNVLILGAGDTARTAIKALEKLQFQNITVAVRNTQSDALRYSKNVIKILDIRYISSFRNYDILINTIPENEYVTSKMIDNPKLTIIDAIYHKPFLNDSNCKYISGMEWLAEQAIPAIEKIFNIEYSYSDIISRLVNYKSLKSNIVLTGFMATGKTSIGLELSKKLGWNFIDVDEKILKKTGLEISVIFEKYGEAYFRELESECILNLPITGNYIIALGGGVLNSNGLADYIMKNFYVVYIYSSLTDIKKRINSEVSNIRPLANIEKIDELYIGRGETYFNTSDLIINNCNDLLSTVNKLYNEICSSF